MKSILIAALGAALSAGATGCAALDLPPALAGKAEVLADTDPDYAKGGLGSAVLPPRPR